MNFLLDTTVGMGVLILLLLWTSFGTLSRLGIGPTQYTSAAIWDAHMSDADLTSKIQCTRDGVQLSHHACKGRTHYRPLG